MTLEAELPTSIETISRLDGGKNSAPWSRGAAVRAPQAQEKGDGVVGKLGVSDMALLAVDGQQPGERTATANLDRIAKRLRVGGLAEHAVVDPFTTRLQPFNHFHRAVDVQALFIAGNQERDASLVRHTVPNGCGKGGSQPAFHVDRPTPVEHAIGDFSRERPVGP